MNLYQGYLEVAMPLKYQKIDKDSCPARNLFRNKNATDFTRAEEIKLSLLVS